MKKSLNRFYIFGLALVATLFIFGGRHDYTPNLKSEIIKLSAEVSSIHPACPCHQPFEIENKEEQPTTEDDESRESAAGIHTDNSFSLTFVQDATEQSDNLSLSKSQTQYHTPAYVRLRSILI